MSRLRFSMVENAIARKAQPVDLPDGRPTEYFGSAVFNKKTMQKYLPSAAYSELLDTMNNHTQLTRSLADSVAYGMKQWAIDMGATHYTHWFQPLTGGTAEKHDAFLEFNSEGLPIEQFSGSLLSQQEGDASSFPNGGTRSTFEARGYSAWDPTSPAFVVEDTLCIPTIFVSYNGDSLDFKTPLLKSIEQVSRAATAVCKFFDPTVKRVNSFLGWEQEYFLVDEGLWAARPDLVLTGRTLMGHESSKNQQLEDHYFGAIPQRVVAFMRDLEFECWRLGIPAKTRHNEVAPGQFEIAPIFENANLANDHNLLLMTLMSKVASKHNFKVLLHEKPFKGINGSGKHCNWSLGIDGGKNLFSPGKTDKDNLRFVSFMAATLDAVFKHNALLKATIASATNAHRLGANEAPPAIISVFLGRQIADLFSAIEKSETEETVHVEGKSGFRLSLQHIPELFIDNTDRNRTSPFAFTGNRFEFRAVGSTANCAGVITAINTAVAQSLVEFKNEVDILISNGVSTPKAVYTIARKFIVRSKAIHFDGNGYSDEWKKEAKERGLDVESSVPLILDNYMSKSTIDLFESMGVMNRTELQTRAEVYWETYTKKIQIEARVMGDLVMNHILPVASSYQAELLDKVFKIRTIFDQDKAAEIGERDMSLIEKISKHIAATRMHVDKMVAARRVANIIDNEREKAIKYHDTVAPEIENAREFVDKLELIVDNERWTLPKYRELLFLR